MAYRFTKRVLASVQERNRKIHWLPITSSLKTRITNRISHTLPAEGIRRIRRLFLLVSDHIPVRKAMSDIAPVAVAIVFWLAVIVSLFVLLVQGLTILFRAILHAFVCTFTAVGTFIWLNVVSISSYLLTIAWRNLTNTLYFLSYPLAALFFDISSLTYENVFVNVIAGDKFEYFILARLGSCILLLSAVLAAFWFRNTLSGTFVSEIDEVEDDTNGKLISMQI